MAIALIVYDFIILLLSCALYGGAALGTWWLVASAAGYLPLWALILLWPAWVVLFLLLLIGEIFILRLLSPPIPEGKFLAPGSAAFWIWTWRFSLRRLISIVPINTIINWSALLRWLCYRSLGMELAFNSSMSSDVILIDPGLLSVGPRCVIGGRTLIGCHYMNKFPDGDKIVIKRSRIGANVNIGMDVVIGPGVIIGDDCTIGTNCHISTNITIGKGATIKPYSQLPPKTVVPEGSVWPPAEPREAG